MPLYRRAFDIDEREHDTLNQQIGLSNLGDTLREIGNLREGEGALLRALNLSRELKDAGREAISLHFQGRLFGTRGHNNGHVLLMRSRRMFIKLGSRQYEGITDAYLAERSLWLGNLIKAGAWGERAWDLATNLRHERDFIRAALLQGKLGLTACNIARADERLHDALTRARAVNLVELELPALIAIAELELQRGHPSEAKARLDDVWDAAERGPYRLQQADAYNVLAAIAQTEGDTAGAIDAATKAYRAAWCDGPPYAYHWGLQKAKQHLAALGAAEPDMPPFDESKFEPLPEVEINPKDEYWGDPEKLD
jgi:tetratricopeptide (TPR) repeat protein